MQINDSFDHFMHDFGVLCINLGKKAGIRSTLCTVMHNYTLIHACEPASTTPSTMAGFMGRISIPLEIDTLNKIDYMGLS